MKTTVVLTVLSFATMARLALRQLDLRRDHQ